MAKTITKAAALAALVLIAPHGAAAADANATMTTGNHTKMQRLCPHVNGGTLRFWQSANEPVSLEVLSLDGFADNAPSLRVCQLRLTHDF